MFFVYVRVVGGLFLVSGSALLSLLGRKVVVELPIQAFLAIAPLAILFAFFIVAAGDGFLLETARGQVADFVKRLGFYRLRAKVVIADVSEAFDVLAAWGSAPPAGEGFVFADPRAASLGWRVIAPKGASAPGDMEPAYHARRMRHGVPAIGRDFATNEVFPHEALFDIQNGVDFGKGCYVGQEVVSRMQHRGTARSRFLPIVAASELPPRGTEIRAGAARVGTMAGHEGGVGLALVRLDRLAAAGQAPLAAGDVPASIAPADVARVTPLKAAGSLQP